MKSKQISGSLLGNEFDRFSIRLPSDKSSALMIGTGHLTAWDLAGFLKPQIFVVIDRSEQVISIQRDIFSQLILNSKDSLQFIKNLWIGCLDFTNIHSVVDALKALRKMSALKQSDLEMRKEFGEGLGFKDNIQKQWMNFVDPQFWPTTDHSGKLNFKDAFLWNYDLSRLAEDFGVVEAKLKDSHLGYILYEDQFQWMKNLINGNKIYFIQSDWNDSNFFEKICALIEEFESSVTDIHLSNILEISSPEEADSILKKIKKLVSSNSKSGATLYLTHGTKIPFSYSTRAL